MTDTPTVICDLDGTLCNIDHRLHYLKENKDWDTFYDNWILIGLGIIEIWAKYRKANT